MANSFNPNFQSSGTYRTNTPTPNINFNPQPQANPVDALMQGLERGQTLGLRAKQQAMLEQEAIRKQKEFELEQEKNAIENIKTKSAFYDTEWFKLMEPEKQDAIHQSFLRDLKTVTKLDIDDVGSKYEKIDAPFAKAIGAVFNDDKLPSMEDKRFAVTSILSEAQKKGVTKDQLASLKGIAEFGLGANKKTSSYLKPLDRVSEDGRPLFWDSANRGFFVVNPDGTDAPYYGKQLPAQANPSSGSETKLSSVLQQRSLVDEALTLLTPEKVGAIDRSFRTVGDYIEESTDPEAVQFKSIVEMANTIIRNDYYGATLTGNEKKAFQDIALNRNISPSAFRAKAQALQFSFNKMEDGIRKASAASNRPFRDGGSKSKTIVNDDQSGLSNLSDEELLKIAEGGN